MFYNEQITRLLDIYLDPLHYSVKRSDVTGNLFEWLLRETMLYKTPYPIFHCLSYLDENGKYNFQVQFDETIYVQLVMNMGHLYI